uniref:RRM domain-containing protein n=1 Tax=Cebus imitator TaxID=2715852 RepID=A0A2K5R0W0_CEBIM
MSCSIGHPLLPQTGSSSPFFSLSVFRSESPSSAISNTTIIPSTVGPCPSGRPGSGTEVIQVTNVSPSASSEMQTLFGFLDKTDKLCLFPPDDSPLPVSSRVCFVKFRDPDSVAVARHLTNTVFIDTALTVVPHAEGVIPDEAKALSLLAPANAVAGLLPNGGLLPTPNTLTQIGAVPLAVLGALTLDPTLAALGRPGANLNSQSLATDQLLKLMSTVDPKLNHVAAGLVLPSLKSDTSSEEIEEAMKRVREAQSRISAAIEPKKEEKRRHSRSHRWSRNRSRGQSHSEPRSRRRSKSPRRRRSHSRERGRRSRSTSKMRDKKKEDKEKKCSKPPPKSYSTVRCSRRSSRERQQCRDRSGTRSPKKPQSPKRKLSRSPSPRRHKKEKKKDKDKERGRDEREQSTSKKKKSKDKGKDQERKSESDKDVKQVTRDYEEEEQGYDSEKEKKPTETGSPKTKECSVEKGTGDSLRESKVNGDDHHEEGMDMSD